jgi:hypothetical protein
MKHVLTRLTRGCIHKFQSKSVVLGFLGSLNWVSNMFEWQLILEFCLRGAKLRGCNYKVAWKILEIAWEIPTGKVNICFRWLYKSGHRAQSRNSWGLCGMLLVVAKVVCFSGCGRYQTHQWHDWRDLKSFWGNESVFCGNMWQCDFWVRWYGNVR